MNPDIRPDARSPLTRFLDSFLQERNIQWVLAAGMTIVLGSTLMLVLTHWDAYTPAWKYLIMLAYTGAIYLAGQWSYHEMGLRKTGTVLMALTVLLLPVMFLALHWVQRPGSDPAAWLAEAARDRERADSVASQLGGFASHGVNLLLLVTTIAFGVHSARRVFDHFLRRPQATFLVSYLILCVSGTFAPALPSKLAAWASLVLWGVFTLGAVKVNRHVFWLTEEHSAPRTFGFFPIALLGAQFFSLFALNFASHVPLEWLGFGCVLVAVPVLLTADGVARVFQRRTGDLVRPLPWPIVIPLLAGLMLCASGVCMAAAGLVAPRSPYALVPSAVLVAAMMFVVSRRTGKQAFVWAMLAALTIAYNFSPVFFQEVARLVVRVGAEAVREERLPYAFYGLTYLPLLAVLTAAGTFAERKGNYLFGPPIRAFSMVLACLLLAASLGHVKAMFPVATLMAVTFGAMTVCFRRPSLAAAAVAAWLIAAYGVTPFLNDVLELALPPTTSLVCLVGAAASLLVPGCWIDRRVRTLAVKATPSDAIDWYQASTCQVTSACITLIVALNWGSTYVDARGFVDNTPVDLPGVVAAIALAILLFAHSLRWLQPMLSGVALVFWHVVIATVALRAGVHFGVVISIVTLAFLAQWLISYIFERGRETRIATAFGSANRLLCTIGLSVALLGFLPFAFADMLGVPRLMPVTPWWLCRVLVVAWSFDAARRSSNEVLAGVGCLAGFATLGAVLIEIMGSHGREWLPALWAAAAVACLPIAQFLRRRVDSSRESTVQPAQTNACRALAGPIDAIVFIILSLTSFASLGVFTMSMRIAGLIALVGVLTVAALRRNAIVGTISFVLMNWQIAVLTIVLSSSGRLQTVLDLASPEAISVFLPVSLVSAVSLLLWQRMPRSLPLTVGNVAGVHRIALRVVTAVSLGTTLTIAAPTAFQLVLAFLTFLLLIVGELIEACRQQSESRVWVAEAIVAAAVGYFAWHGVIHFGRGISMFVVLGSALSAWLLSRVTARHIATLSMARPLEQTALALPAVTVLIGFYRHVTVAHPHWLGMNSLALVLAAGFYFWHGIERRRHWSLVASALVLNCALILLWRDLVWTDPQFYMIPIGLTILALVRLLKAEIPPEAHGPLNYLGALVILVSPTFHIVTGSWLHLFTLMLLSVCVVLGAIGFRVRALMYAGSAFLIADLVAMLIRGSIDDPNRLWIAGVVLGAAVVGLGAIAERNRAELLQRVRIVSATLQAWN